MARNDVSMDHLRHALVIDERRYYFRPTNVHANVYHANHTAKQVWFVGCHCDVGGGHNEKKSGYSDISLGWMLSKASQAGLPLQDDWRSSQYLASSSSRSSTEIHFIPYNESLRGWWRLESKRAVDTPARHLVGAVVECQKMTQFMRVSWTK